MSNAISNVSITSNTNAIDQYDISGIIYHAYVTYEARERRRAELESVSEGWISQTRLTGLLVGN